MEPIGFLNANRARADKSAGKILLIGDSWTVQCRSTAGLVTYRNLPAEGFFTWANALSGNRFKVDAYLGVGGDTTRGVLSRLPAALAASDAKYVHVMAGLNDAYVLGASASEIMTWLRGIVDVVQGEGRVPILATIPANRFSTSAILRTVLSVNDQIKEWGIVDKSVKFWDCWSALVDPSSTTQNIGRAAYYRDSPNIHPNALGAYYAGKALADVLSRLEDPVPMTYGSVNYTTTGGATGDFTNLLDNPGFQAGAGGTLSTGMSAGTGTVPEGVTISRATGTPSATINVGAYVDPITKQEVGKYIEIVPTATAASDSILVSIANLASRFATNAEYRAEATITLGDNPTGINSVRGRVQPNSGASESSWFNNNDYTAVDYLEGFTARFQSDTVRPQGAVVTGAFEVRVGYSANTTTPVRVALPAVRRVRTYT